MLLDSFAHAEEDVKARLLTEQRVEADRIAAAARAAMADSARAARPPRTRRRSTRRWPRWRRRAAGPTTMAIRAAVEALDVASKEFAARRMNVAFERGLRGKDVAAVEAKVDETAPKQRPWRRAPGSHAGHSEAR